MITYINTIDIDRTHIIALQEVDGLLKKVELPIDRPEMFISELKAMVNNPNRTVWDMQSHFTSRFPKTNEYLDYIHPFSYQDTYVGGVNYPHMFDYNDLQRSWADAAYRARMSCRFSINQDDSARASIISQAESNAVNYLKMHQKNEFITDAIRWINASCYCDAANKLANDKSVKMFSKENIGWSAFSHSINNDVKVAIRTNFGYGNSAHFLLAVQYKGVDILPYSYIVKYYNARMADIVRCTRSYSPCRESWSASFDFLSDFVNNSIADPKGFVESYIMREVVEMMQGLEAIAINPKGFIDRIGSRTADPYVINVRPMFSDERTRMQSYPEETSILFKVEKIVGALDFLKNLTAIANEVTSVQPHIDRLIEINLSLYPEIQDAIAKINDKIAEQIVIKTDLDTQIAILNENLAPFEEEVTRLCAEATSDHPFVINDYESTHPKYVELKGNRNDKQTQLYKINRLISDLNAFLGILHRSIEKLDEVRQSKQAA